MEQDCPATWLAACEELEELLAHVETSIDLVALVQAQVHLSADGEARHHPPTVPTEREVTQHNDIDPQIDEQYHLQPCEILSSFAPQDTSTPSSIYSINNSYALENARLTEPFSPDYLPPDFQSAESSHPGPPSDQFGLSSVVLSNITKSPRSTPPSLTSLKPPQSSSTLESDIEEIGTDSFRHKNNMVFGDFHKNSAAAHRKRSMATTSALTDYEADLTSRDRMKQREAIKRILADKLREDWTWKWPKEGDEPGTPVVNRSLENVSEHDWTERDEWASNASESEDNTVSNPELQGFPVGSPEHEDGANNKDPFRFDSPEGLGETLRKTAEDRKTRRRRNLQEEMRINDGLRCFTHRRNAWTCARHVRRSPRTPSTGVLSRTHSRTDPSTQCQDENYLDFTTEVPIASPILPPETPMRKGINEKAYATIYDKVILQSQTPLCPINLSIVTKSCVEGWKRDGEWPPRVGEVDAVAANVRKLGVGAREAGRGNGGRVRAALGAGGLERRESEGKDAGGKNKGVIRRSLQKVMGAVRERAGSKGKDE